MSFSALRIQEAWFLFPLIVVGIWLGACLLVSCAGWRSFARKCRARTQPVGEVHRAVRVRLGFMGWYRNSVRVVFAEEGIHFSASWVHRAFHAPFLLSWKSVRRLRKKGCPLRGNRFIVEVEDAQGRLRLWLSKEMEDDFFRHYRPEHPTPQARRAFPRGHREDHRRGMVVGVGVRFNEVVEPRA
ncbi:hypothetical protein [Roseimicrobium sp. ORNL1]|uniref:hypothetical protein n=1 Tax=Roseimicrobium sp. ORNL1 TaxID=2711231 RepID=UPI0013E1575B|nr:hypothetical protein [Roseimicrobium sp. ORNL1]QIF05484.1 hypothetical protein G5S37_29625 [Roseimicrobium sp. ORNL1]